MAKDRTASWRDDTSLEPCLADSERQEDPHDVTPPDGGYGWVVVFSSFCISTLIAIGSVYGVFFMELLEYYEESYTVTAWPTSINIGFGLGAGPLASFLSNRIGHRLTCILGSLLCTVGFLVCGFAQNIYFWYVGYGVMCGIGYSLQFVTMTVMAGSYFSRRRNLATGLAVSGIGVGIFLNAPILDLCIRLYTWRGATIILAGLSLQASVFASLLRPLPGITDLPDQEDSLDTSLLADWRLLVFATVELLWNIGASVYISLLPDFAYNQGLPKQASMMLLSHSGLGSLLGRLFFAFGTNCQFCNPTVLYVVATLVSGLCIFGTIMTLHYALFVFSALLYGACFGMQASLAPVITVNLFGLKRMTSAYGYLLLGDGIGCIIGPPVAGFIFDVTASYAVTWISCGALTTLSGLLMISLLLKCAQGPLESTFTSSEVISMTTIIEERSESESASGDFKKVDAAKVKQSVTYG